MKRMFLLLSSLLITHHAFSQVTSGTITYNEVTKINLRGGNVEVSANGISEEQLKQIEALIPKETGTKKTLRFNASAALYQNAKTENTDNDNTQSMGGASVMIVNASSSSNDKVYYDIQNKKLIQQQEFMSRKFLITSEAEASPWKLTGNSKQILGYPCQEATLKRDSTTITAWFTPAISVSAGPRGLYGLPGMILVADLGDNITITATEVHEEKIGELPKPKDGKKVTSKEYEKIVAEKLKEMQAQYGGRNGVVIERVISR
jgi:GLPGLI family protein